MQQQASQPNSNPGDIVTQLQVNDVLFGRGSGPNDHEGNIRFRALVGERKAEYLTTNHRQTKTKIARDIVDAVLSQNGRFLKKVESAEAKIYGIPKGIDAWMVVDDETIMEKAKQALRQQRDKGKPEDTSPPPASVATQSSETGASKQEITDIFQPYPAVSESSGGTDEKSAQPQGFQANLKSPQPSPLHPNPYEPFPIGSNSLDPMSSSAEWSNFATAAILAQTQAAYSQRGQQLDVADVAQLLHVPPREEKGSCRTEGSRRESIQVSDLMDSLNKMKTREFDVQEESSGTMSSRNQESSETMGTIEPLPIGPGKEPPFASELAMSSTTLALMKGALQDSSRAYESSMLKGGFDSSIDPNVFGSTSLIGAGNLRSSIASTRSGDSSQRDLGRQSITIEDGDFFRKVAKLGASGSDLSMNFSQVWNEIGQNKGNNLDDVNEDDEEDDISKGNKADSVAEPDEMSGLGKSSIMSIANVSMMGESGSMSVAHDSIFSDEGDA
jgi:hypothetical protein